MATVRIQSRTIPRNILSGEVEEYKTVNIIFLNTIIREYLKRVFYSYQDRSNMDDSPDMTGQNPVHGNVDDYGNSWVQLHPNTILKKADERSKGTYRDYLAGIKSFSAERVLAAIDKLDDMAGEGINIRTGRLLASFFPPPLIGAFLRLGPDQNVEVYKTQAHFDNDSVPYAEDVQRSKRPIIPSGMDVVWAQEAADIAITAAESEYNRLKRREVLSRKPKPKKDNY